MREFARTERIGVELHRALADILRSDVKDPRLGGVTLQEVRVTRDLSHAKVFFTCFPMDEGGKERERLLNGKLAGFLRHELARRVQMRTVPQLHFQHDDSVLHGERLSNLIDEALAADHTGPQG